jgi:hypothetical protein
MPEFQTVIRRACFVYSRYTATGMQGFAQVLADSVRATEFAGATAELRRTVRSKARPQYSLNRR